MNVQLAKTIRKLSETEKFKIVLEDDEQVKLEVFELRYQMLSELQPLSYNFSSSSKADRQEADKYDQHSKYCIIKLGEKVIGFGRLILGQREDPASSFITQEGMIFPYQGTTQDNIMPPTATNFSLYQHPSRNLNVSISNISNISSTYDFFTLLTKALKDNVELPSAGIDGRVHTLNQKGAMAPKIDI